MSDSSAQLRLLRQRIAILEAHGRTDAPAPERFATGHADLDAALGGGLLRGRLHELFALHVDDAPSASGFALLLAAMASGSGETILWLRTRGAERQSGGVHAPGLAELGVDPARLLFAILPDEATLLAASADALRSNALGALILDIPGNPRMLDLTASRRLALAAEARRAPVFLLRTAAEPAPSAAETRWDVRAAASAPFAADAPGAAAFDIALLRHRAGRDGLAWRLEWNRDQSRFAPWGSGPAAYSDASLSGAVVSPAADRPVAAINAA